MIKIRNGSSCLNTQPSNKKRNIFYIQLRNKQKPRMFRILVISASDFGFLVIRISNF